MQLTAEEEAHTRQVAAQIGRNPDDLICEGGQVKASGWRSAQQQAEGCAAFRRRRRPRDGPRPVPRTLAPTPAHGGAPRPPRAGSPERMEAAPG